MLWHIQIVGATYAFRDRAGPPAAGNHHPSNAYVPPIIGGVLTVITQVLTWQKLPVVVAIFLGLFVFVAGALVGRAALRILNPNLPGGLDVGERVVSRIINAIGWILIFGMGATFTSLFLGWPLDLRNLVRPDLISRQKISAEPRPLTPIPLSNFAKVTLIPGASQAQLAQELQNVLFQWIMDGAVPADQSNALAYVFELPFDGFYSPFDAQLTFNSDDTQKPLAARLVDGIALLETQTANGGVTYRQVPWFIDRHNGLESDPNKSKVNKLFGVMPNQGEKLILIAKLTSFDKTPLVVGAADLASHLSINP